MDNKKTLDIYSDLLFANQSLATATSFSDALDGELFHEHFSRFLKNSSFDGKSLWQTCYPAK